MKLKWLTILFFFISFPIAANHYEEKPAEKYDDISLGIVLIQSEMIREQSEDLENPLEKFIGPPDNPDLDNFGNGMGTGFFISDTHIVTNYHVVKNSNKITLYSYAWPFDITTAKVIGYDEMIDIAILEIPKEEEFPRSILEFKKEKPRVGDKVYALGHGLGQFWSLTEGIISTDYRPSFTTTFVHYYQTDAVINQGNSGGPLLDDEGHVVGVNTLIWSPTKFYIGYGYAIPAKLVEVIAKEIIETGTFRKPKIGIGMGITEDRELYALTKELGYDSVLEIQEVTPDSSAEVFGLLVGDLIVEVDGKPVVFSADIIEMLWQKNPGDEMTFKFIRNSELMTITLTLGES